MSDLQQHARNSARKLADELDLEERLIPYSRLRWEGSAPGRPALHLDDFSAIPFLVDISGVEEYQHRARLRAAGGDLVASVTPVSEGYEEYCRRRLALPAVEWIHPRPVKSSLELATACRRGRGADRILEIARQAGGLVIHPFMGSETVWGLAEEITERTGAEVKVLAPPPPVSWIANDKETFSRLVSRVLGGDWLVETHPAASVQELARLLGQLVERHQRVGLKRLRCASAMGNGVWDSSELRGLDREGLSREVEGFLTRTEWDGEEAVLAVAWEDAELSPSTQLWIPAAGFGPPRVDGVYEQILEGRRRVFVGSRPTGLPQRVVARLGEASLALAAALQELGYVGRCSFDFLLLGEPEGEFQLRLTECNGRWGGTSTPMALLDRLFPEGRPPYRAQDLVDEGLLGLSFPELLRRVGDAAFDARSRRGRFIFYNTGPLAAYGKLDVIALSRTQEGAEEAMGSELPRLLGL